MYFKYRSCLTGITLSVIIIFLITGCSKDIQKTETNEFNIKQIDMPNWKTYTNTKFSYQINYPSDIQTTQSPEANDVIFYKNSGTNLEMLYTIISTDFNPGNLSLDNYLKMNYEKWLGSQSSYQNFSVNEPIIFNGMQAIKFATETDEFMIFGRGKYIFIVRHPDKKKIISAFKFIESGPHIYDSDYEPYTSDWKFYNNGAFTFNYPKNWKINFDSKKVSVFDDSHEFSVVVSADKPSDSIYNSLYKEPIKLERFNTTAYIFPSEFYIPIEKDNLWFTIKGKGNLQNIASSLYGQIIYTFGFIEPQY